MLITWFILIHMPFHLCKHICIYEETLLSLFNKLKLHSIKYLPFALLIWEFMIESTSVWLLSSHTPEIVCQPHCITPTLRLLRWLSGKESACQAGDPHSMPGLGRYPGEGNSNPLQYSCLESLWTEEPGGLQSVGSQRVRHHWGTKCQDIPSTDKDAVQINSHSFMEEKGQTVRPFQRRARIKGRGTCPTEFQGLL